MTMKCVLALLLVLCLLSLFTEVDSRRGWRGRIGRNGRNGHGRTVNGRRGPHRGTYGGHEASGSDGASDHDDATSGTGDAEDDGNHTEDAGAETEHDNTHKSDQVCPDGWIAIPELRRCYLVETTPRTYSDAQEICQMKGGTLWTNIHPPSKRDGCVDCDTVEAEEDYDEVESDDAKENDMETDDTELGTGEEDENIGEDREEEEPIEGDEEEDDENEEENEDDEEETYDNDDDYEEEEELEEEEEDRNNNGNDNDVGEKEEEIDNTNGGRNSGVDEEEKEEYEDSDEERDQEDVVVDIDPTCSATVLKQRVHSAVYDALAAFTDENGNDQVCGKVKDALNVIADILSDEIVVSGSVVEEALQPVIDEIVAVSNSEVSGTESTEGVEHTRNRRHTGSRVTECWFGINGGHDKQRELCLEAVEKTDGQMVLQWTRCDQALVFVCQTEMLHPTEDQVQSPHHDESHGQRGSQGRANGRSQGQDWRRWERYWSGRNWGNGDPGQGRNTDNNHRGEGRNRDGSEEREGRNNAAPWRGGGRRWGGDSGKWRRG